MARHVVLEGTLTTGGPPGAALGRFTPEGERDRVPGWDPVYADAVVGDGGEPGTVFTTHSATGMTTWIVLDRDEHRVRYARVTAGRTAGTVTLSCRAAKSPQATTVTVVYDLAALGREGETDLAELSGDYDGYLAGWETAIAALDEVGGVRP